MPANPEDPNTGLDGSRRTQHCLPMLRGRDVCGWLCPVSEASRLSLISLCDNVWPPIPSCSQREISSIDTSAKSLPDIFRVCSGSVVPYDDPVWVFQVPGEQPKKFSALYWRTRTCYEKVIVNCTGFCGNLPLSRLLSLLYPLLQVYLHFLFFL